MLNEQDVEHAEKAEIDRLGELANVGAGHAANAFAQLVGRAIRNEVPVVIEGEPVGAPASDAEATGDGSTGVFFEFEGCLDAVVAILFPGRASELLVRQIVGIESGELEAPVTESALMEGGNILASHVASAIADTLGSRLLPSIPQLEMAHAEQALDRYIADTVGQDSLRIESAFSDASGELRGRLVLVPTRWPAASLAADRT